MSDSIDKLIQVTMDASPTALIQVDSEGTIVRANRACGPLLRYGADELRGMSVDELLPEAQQQSHKRHRRYFMADPVSRPMGDGRKLHARRRDGSEVVVEVRLTPVEIGGAPCVFGAVSDLSDRQRAEDQLKLVAQQLDVANRRLNELAATDILTGVRNRRAFFEDLAARLALARRSSHPLSLVMVDLDRFQDYNDQHGQQAGDAALKGLAGVLRTTSRQSDVVARYRDEVFVVILPETNAPGGSRCAERIQQAMATTDWAYRPLTASYGVATYAPDGEAVGRLPVDELCGQLVDQARRALARAKQEGRNRVIHADTLVAHEASSES